MSYEEEFKKINNQVYNMNKDRVNVEDITNLVYCLGERKYDRTQEKNQRAFEQMKRRYGRE